MVWREYQDIIEASHLNFSIIRSDRLDLIILPLLYLPLSSSPHLLVCSSTHLRLAATLPLLGRAWPGWPPPLLEMKIFLCAEQYSFEQHNNSQGNSNFPIGFVGSHGFSNFPVGFVHMNILHYKLKWKKHSVGGIRTQDHSNFPVVSRWDLHRKIVISSSAPALPLSPSVSMALGNPEP